MTHLFASYMYGIAQQRNILQNPLSQPQVQKTGKRSSIQSVQWEALACTAVSMDFFDCLIQKGTVIVLQSSLYWWYFF